jgi:hypothetical protein
MPGFAYFVVIDYRTHKTAFIRAKLLRSSFEASNYLRSWDFKGYAEFFLLQDLVAEDFSAVKFFMPFEDFTKSPLPESLESYRAYQQLAIEFINSRNRRILQYANLRARDTA